MLKRLWLDEGGAILSAELLLLMVILVIGLTVGMVAVRDAIDSQLGELALSIAAVDTGFGFTGLAYEDTLSNGTTPSSGYVGGAQRVATYNVDGGADVSELITAIDMSEAKSDGI
jgi:hypothetical protein